MFASLLKVLASYWSSCQVTFEARTISGVASTSSPNVPKAGVENDFLYRLVIKLIQVLCSNQPG